MSDIYVMQNAKGETNSPIQVEFDPIRWALLNPWLSEGQTIRRCSKSGRKRGTINTLHVYQ